MNYFIFWTTLLVLLLIIIWLTLKYDLLKDQSLATPKPYSFARVQLAWWSIIILSSFITVFLLTGEIPTFDTSTLVVLGISALTTASARIIDISDTSNASASAVSAVTSAAAATAAVNTANAANAAKNAANPANVAVKSAADDTAAAAAIAATAASAAAASSADKAILNRNLPGENLILDILSDKNGVNIHRLQAAIFNLVIGIWFLSEVYHHIEGLSLKTALAPVIDPILHKAKDPKDLIINHVLPIITNNNLILLGLSSGTYAALKTTENK
jgi:hypothetical protein